MAQRSQVVHEEGPELKGRREVACACRCALVQRLQVGEREGLGWREVWIDICNLFIVFTYVCVCVCNCIVS